MTARWFGLDSGSGARRGGIFTWPMLDERRLSAGGNPDVL